MPRQRDSSAHPHVLLVNEGNDGISDTRLIDEEKLDAKPTLCGSLREPETILSRARDLRVQNPSIGREA